MNDALLGSSKRLGATPFWQRMRDQGMAWVFAVELCILFLFLMSFWQRSSIKTFSLTALLYLPRIGCFEA
jgi:hypothetical protein